MGVILTPKIIEMAKEKNDDEKVSKKKIRKNEK